MTKTMRETTSMVALGSAPEERDAVKAAFQEVQSSFETFCLLAGIEAFQDLLEEEAADLCGERHQRHEDRRGRRWGKARSPVAFHGGRVDIDRPRVRTPDGQQELELPSLAAGQREDWRWAMNQMLSRPGGSGARFACPMAMSPRPRATAPRSRRCRASSWRCRARN